MKVVCTSHIKAFIKSVDDCVRELANEESFQRYGPKLVEVSILVYTTVYLSHSIVHTPLSYTIFSLSLSHSRSLTFSLSFSLSLSLSLSSPLPNFPYITLLCCSPIIHYYNTKLKMTSFPLRLLLTR